MRTRTDATLDALLTIILASLVLSYAIPEHAWLVTGFMAATIAFTLYTLTMRLKTIKLTEQTERILAR